MRTRVKISKLLKRVIKKIEQHREVPQLAYHYLALLQEYSPNEIRDLMFHHTLETATDGVVEMYEFIAVMQLMEVYQDKTIEEFTKIVTEYRKGSVCDPKSTRFGKNTRLTLPLIPDSRRQEFREAFKFIDSQDTKDGVISEKDLLTAMERYIW